MRVKHPEIVTLVELACCLHFPGSQGMLCCKSTLCGFDPLMRGGLQHSGCGIGYLITRTVCLILLSTELIMMQI